MGRKYKYTPEDKIQAVDDYLSGIKSIQQICTDLGIRYSCNRGGIIRNWAKKYQEFGESVFYHKPHNKSYSSALKLNAIEECFDGKLSQEDICTKYEICSTSILRRWIKKYNSNMELKNYDPKQEVYMASARRKTTINERKEIVIYCIEHKRDYKGTAEKYDVSYSQVYSWVKKYDMTGEDGLADKRGHHKADDEVDELEKLRRENKRLKRLLEERDMAVELLKKVKEFERGRF
jgi:transposase-like protein